MLGEGDSLATRWATVDFLDVECANVLATTTRGGAIESSYAERSLGIIAALPLARWPAAGILESALLLSCAHGISVYDACYVALADALGVALLTADRKLVRKLEDTGHAVVHLGDIGV